MVDDRVVDNEMNVWRYMGFARFVSLLQQKRLWLSRVDCLYDPWEMTLRGPYVERLAAAEIAMQHESFLARHFGGKGKVVALEDMPFYSAKQTLEQWRCSSFVNCWSAGPHESHALWRLYCASKEGVAIHTTLARLVQSVQPLPVHPIRYVADSNMTESLSRIELLTTKRPRFEFEKEVRVVMEEPPVDWDPMRKGVAIAWDPETVLTNVWVHPEGDADFLRTVKGVVASYAPALLESIRWSSMNERSPLWIGR